MAISHICFLGASTTHGQGDEAGLGWPGRLMDLTFEGDPDRPAAYNLGVRGQTTRMLANRWEAEVKQRLPDYGEVAIVISFGLNDIAHIDGGPRRVPLHRTLETAQKILEDANSLAECLWLGPAPVDESVMPIRSEAGHMFDFRNAAALEVNDGYRGIAASLNIPYLDLLPDLIEDPRFMQALKDRDGLHPSGNGYQLIAEKVAGWDAWRDLIK